MEQLALVDELASDNQNLGELIDLAFELREQKRVKEAETKEISAELTTVEGKIFARLEDIGVTTAKATLASATITEQVVPVVSDFEQVLKWIKENDAFYMLQRRISSPAYKEILDMGGEIPGVEPYTKRTISLRKLS